MAKPAAADRVNPPARPIPSTPLPNSGCRRIADDPSACRRPCGCCAHRRRVVTVGQCWPGNRNDVVVARHTVAHLLTGHHDILGDSGYRGVDTITSAARDKTGRIIRDDHHRAHRRIRARVEHVIARLKDRQLLRQCRRRGQAINHSLQIIAGL
jgi:hypothetical protein